MYTCTPLMAQSLGTVRCGHAPFILFILLPIYRANLSYIHEWEGRQKIKQAQHISVPSDCDSWPRLSNTMVRGHTWLNMLFYAIRTYAMALFCVSVSQKYWAVLLIICHGPNALVHSITRPPVKYLVDIRQVTSIISQVENDNLNFELWRTSLSINAQHVSP